MLTGANAVIVDARDGFHGRVPGIHEVLRRQRLLEGIWCLDENETLSPGQLAEIDRVWHTYPHLRDDAPLAETGGMGLTIGAGCPGSRSVSESHFHWTQRERVTRTSTGVRAADCVARDCVVRTANGYQSTSQPEHLSGTYTVTGSTLRIEWAGNGWEQWQVSQPISGKLAKLTYDASSVGATHGYGYGSNAAWTARASMAQIASFDHTRLVHRRVPAPELSGRRPPADIP